MILTALIITDRQEFYRRCEIAFHTASTYTKLSSYQEQEAMEKLAAMEPDLILLDGVINQRAAQLLDQVDQVSLPRRPALFLSLEERSPNWEHYFLRKGALYVFDKSLGEAALVECIMQISTRHRNAEREEELLPELVRIMRRCCLSPRHRGYACILDSVQLLYHQPGYGQSLTKKIYPYIAKKNFTTNTRVEKNIRDAIHHAWNNGGQDVIPEYLGCGRGKVPSNGQLIACICEKLRETLNIRELPYTTV